MNLTILNKLLTFKDHTGRLISEDFKYLPDADAYPDYYDQIQNPRCLTSLDLNLNFELEFYEMIQNALDYNRKGSPIYQDAQTLKDLYGQFLDFEQLKGEILVLVNDHPAIQKSSNYQGLTGAVEEIGLGGDIEVQARMSSSRLSLSTFEDDTSEVMGTRKRKKDIDYSEDPKRIHQPSGFVAGFDLNRLTKSEKDVLAREPNQRPLFLVPGPKKTAALSKDIVDLFGRDGEVQWFTSPPLDVIKEKVGHRLDYLYYKATHPSKRKVERQVSVKDVQMKTAVVGNEADLHRALHSKAFINLDLSKALLTDASKFPL